ncbi:hypothetical protein [Cohnella rhizosphaerae]|uniref:hypothetical protein n=1 Tax=Cohnella rhizosphaerae TaxID=1457232 RepID=UPI003B8A974F
MSLPYTTTGGATAPLYQCASHVHDTLKSVKDHMHGLCAQHAGKLARVETLEGDVFEGHLMHCDRGILYMNIPDTRAFFPGPPVPFGGPGFVLPLVLFNLLTISLL